MPVSPLVAVRIKIWPTSFSFSLAAVNKYGNKERAKSLNAAVRPWKSSATDTSVSKERKGTIRSSSKVVELYAFSAILRISERLKSVKNFSKTMHAVSTYDLPLISSYTSVFSGKVSGTYNPPSAANPCNSAYVDVTLSSERVLLYFITFPPKSYSS